jgi:hypothetical protein
MGHVGANTRDNRVITAMTLLALRLRYRVGDPSLAGKVIAIIIGTSSALLLARLATGGVRVMEGL